MKCIQCGVDNNQRDRLAHSGRCKTCGHPFAFEPTAMSPPLKFTDGFFAKLIQDLSVNGSLFFTEKQLYNLFLRRLERKALRTGNGFQGCGCMLMFLGVPLLGIGIGIVMIPVGIVLLIVGWRHQRQQLQRQPKTFRVEYARFQQLLATWQQANGPPEKLLPPPVQELSPAVVSPEISDYSFDRVVVCDSDSVAQMLIANNLHFEHSCAVVSLRGYPAGIFDTLMEMLRRNPNLSVYALHDASPAGVRMVDALRLTKWFPDPAIAIYDLGLNPRQVMTMRNPFTQSSDGSAQQARRLPDDVMQRLSPEERAWLLEGNYLKLEMFGPQKLLQVVSQGISRSRLTPSSDAGGDSYWSDNDADGAIVFFAADGFG